MRALGAPWESVNVARVGFRTHASYASPPSSRIFSFGMRVSSCWNFPDPVSIRTRTWVFPIRMMRTLHEGRPTSSIYVPSLSAISTLTFLDVAIGLLINCNITRIVGAEIFCATFFWFWVLF